MDTEHMIGCLIHGKLINILNAGTNSHDVSLTVREDKSASGFRTIYQPHMDEHDNLVGDHVTPQQATDGTKIIKKEQVADYLIESFGLTEVQATRVVNEAYFVPLSS